MDALRVMLIGIVLLAVTAGGMAAPSRPDPPRLPNAEAETIEAGSFSPAGALLSDRTAHTATALADGRVLIIGGAAGADGGLGSLTAAEVWVPGTRTFHPTGSLHHARAWHSATLLADGRVLVIGGADGNVPAELWDPQQGTFTPSGTPSEERSGHTATLLADGRVLVAGGYGGQGMIAHAELWDPSSGAFTRAGTLQEVRSHHSATLLPDGRVLLVAGDSDLAFRDSAEVWDPRSQTFALAGALAEARWWHTAELTQDGDVLVIGGLGWDDGPVALGTTELWTPATGTFEPALTLSEARAWHASVALAGGQILVVGGARLVADEEPEPVAIAAAELIDPDADTNVPAGMLSVGRTGHTATLGPDGCVLVAGGAREPMQAATALASAERWCPQS